MDIPEANREDPAEKVYQIHGTDISFSSNPTDFDERAVEKLHEIRQTGRDREVGYDGCDPHRLEPRDMPGDLFVFRSPDTDSSKFDLFWYGRGKRNAGGGWQLHGTYGVWEINGGGFRGLKRCYVYHEGGHKTNRIMNVYSLIHEDFIKTDGIQLCHVFQSDNYDPQPMRKPDYYVFPAKEVDARASYLETLMVDPDAFKDIDEFGPFTVIPNDGKRKKSNVWDDFTEIKVLRPDGVRVATLAICGPCGMVYVTGTLREDEKEEGKYKFKNNGTNTLKEHKCRGQ